MQPVGACFGVALGWGVVVRPWRLPSTSSAKAKQHTEYPRQHAAVVDNAHRTAVSSMSTRLGDSKLIEGYEKKRTGPSFGFSVEYVGFAEMHIRTLGLVGGTGHSASPLLP